MHPQRQSNSHPSAPFPVKPRAWVSVTILIFLWLLLYGSFALFAPPLLDDADSVHAEVAREMILRHDPVTLYANGIRYLEKAPLLYWNMAASFRLFGVSTGAARLPLAFYTLALFLVTYALGCRLFASDLAGFYATLVLVTSPGIFLFTRILIPDVLVCLWIALAMLCFWRSLAHPSRATAAGFGAACALNVLSKGLIGIVFPIAIVLGFLLLTRNLKHLRRWHPTLGLLVFLAIAAPWHIAAGLANPTQGHPPGLNPTPGNVRGFFWFYFINEHVLRYLNQRVPRDYDTVPLLLFWGLLLVWLFPWCVFLFRALGRVPLRQALRRQLFDSKDSAQLLLALWAAIPLVFFSFSTRQEYYVLPSVPPLALMIGAWLARGDSSARAIAAPALADRTPTPGLRTALLLFLFGAMGAAAALFFALRSPTPAPGADLAEVLKQNPGEYALSLGHFLDLSTQAMGFFRPELLTVAAAFLLGTLLHLVFRRQAHAGSANAALAAMMVVFLIAAHRALVTFSPVLSSARLAAVIRPYLQPSDLVVINGEFESGSTLSFYLHRPLNHPVHILNGRSSNLWYGSFFPDAPQIFEDDASIRALWSSPTRVFLWTEADHPPQFPGPAYLLAKSGGKEILSNRPTDDPAPTK